MVSIVPYVMSEFNIPPEPEEPGRGGDNPEGSPSFNERPYIGSNADWDSLDWDSPADFSIDNLPNDTSMVPGYGQAMNLEIIPVTTETTQALLNTIKGEVAGKPLAFDLLPHDPHGLFAIRYFPDSESHDGTVVARIEDKQEIGIGSVTTSYSFVQEGAGTAIAKYISVEVPEPYADDDLDSGTLEINEIFFEPASAEEDMAVGAVEFEFTKVSEREGQELLQVISHAIQSKRERRRQQKDIADNISPDLMEATPETKEKLLSAILEKWEAAGLNPQDTYKGPGIELLPPHPHADANDTLRLIVYKDKQPGGKHVTSYVAIRYEWPKESSVDKAAANDAAIIATEYSLDSSGILTKYTYPTARGTTEELQRSRDRSLNKRLEKQLGLGTVSEAEVRTLLHDIINGDHFGPR